MPLQDRQDFQAWLEARTAGMVGRRHGDPNDCASCGNDLAHHLNTTECLVCLAEQFGTETAERWLTEAIAGFIRAASDPPALARMLAESIANARELAETHAPPAAWAAATRSISAVLGSGGLSIACRSRVRFGGPVGVLKWSVHRR